MYNYRGIKGDEGDLGAPGERGETGFLEINLKGEKGYSGMPGNPGTLKIFIIKFHRLYNVCYKVSMAGKENLVGLET